VKSATGREQRLDAMERFPSPRIVRLGGLVHASNSKQQIKTAAASMGIGLAVFALIAYALMLLSVTQSLAFRNPPDEIASR
jgi:hypothetical protein